MKSQKKHKINVLTASTPIEIPLIEYREVPLQSGYLRHLLSKIAGVLGEYLSDTKTIPSKKKLGSVGSDLKYRLHSWFDLHRNLTLTG